MAQATGGRRFYPQRLEDSRTNFHRVEEDTLSQYYSRMCLQASGLPPDGGPFAFIYLTALLRRNMLVHWRT